MVARILQAAGGAVLLGSLLVGCGGTADDDPGEVAETPDLGEAQEDRERPERNVTNDEVILVVDDGTDVHEDCENRKVVVSADDANVVLDGDCDLVRATGRGSVVEVGTAVKIVLAGVDNQISFASGEPEVINQGRNTTVGEGGSAEY
ncbi:DUF3060 domain-containing protein [Nocardiopsis oceani]